MMPLTSPPLPVIPLDQPYASWCFARPAPGAAPVKRIETRARPWKHRGWVGIHATAAPVDGAVSVRGGKAIARALGHPLTLTYPKGAIIGVVRLTDCYPMTDATIAAQTDLERAMGVWRPGRYAWCFDCQTLFPTPFPFKGKQGVSLWVAPADVQKLLLQLDEAFSL